MPDAIKVHLTHCNLHDIRHGHNAEIPPAAHDQVAVLKATAAENAACELMDAMAQVPIYVGDGRLYELKRAADEALSALRYTAEAIRWRGADPHVAPEEDD